MTTNPINTNDSGLQIFDSSTGDFAATSLTTKGDLLVKNASDYVRLPVGTNGKVLTADSGEASGLAWDDISFTGDMILLSTQTASSSSSLTFTDLDPTTYATYFINIVDLHPENDSVSLQCLMSTDNGSTFLSSAYQYVYTMVDSGSGANDENHSSSATYIEAADRIGNSVGEGVAGWFWYLPASTPATQFIQSIEWLLYGQDAGTDLNSYMGGGINPTTSQVDAIRFQLSAGNIESGKIYLYGLERS